MTSHRLTFITPLFSKGSYDDRPEIRPSSIRGQLHWWFRALGGSQTDEKAIFGGVHGGAVASKVVVRVNNIAGQTGEVATLPHKSGGQASPKWAFKPGSACDLHISGRLGGLSGPEGRLQKAFDRTLETWLLLGTLGLRGTRAGGSFFWDALTEGALSMPATFEQWQASCEDRLKGASLKFHLIDHPFASAEEARYTISDTIGGRDDRDGDDSLARIRHPLGRVFGGRKTSPLRFRIIPIGGQFHIAAVWDDREKVTGNRSGDLEEVIRLLQAKGKGIGHLLSGFR